MGWREYLLATTVLRVLARVFARFPLRRRRIVLATARTRMLEGNLAYLHRAIRRMHQDRDVTLLLEPYTYGVGGKLAYFARLIRGMYYLQTSGLVVVDNAYLPIHVAPHRPETTVVQVWHAGGALKRFGADAPAQQSAAERRFLHRGYDYVVVGGEAARRPYASALRTPVERVLPIGSPRTDFFFDEAAMAAARERILRTYPQLRGRRVVLYAPTFRGRGSNKRPAPGFDAPRLRARLDAEWALALKTHPNLPPGATPTAGYDAVIDAATDINHVFTATDVLVTDYSSSVFEWALLRRPLVLLVPDLEAYAADPGLYLDYRTDMIGTQVRSTEELLRVLADERFDLGGYEAFVARHLHASDGRASERFVERFVGPPRRTGLAHVDERGRRATPPASPETGMASARR